MRLNLSFATVVLFLIYQVASSSDTTAEDEQKLFVLPKLVGKFGKKTFYVDYSSLRTWYAGRDYCKLFLGMRLAEIKSLEEHKYLAERNAAGKLPMGYYWTGGRDSGKVSQFVWNRRNAEVLESLPLVNVNGPYTCIMFFSTNGSSSGEMRGVSCSSSYFTLCEVYSL